MERYSKQANCGIFWESKEVCPLDKMLLTNQWELWFLGGVNTSANVQDGGVPRWGARCQGCTVLCCWWLCTKDELMKKKDPVRHHVRSRIQILKLSSKRGKSNFMDCIFPNCPHIYDLPQSQNQPAYFHAMSISGTTIHIKKNDILRLPF